MLKIHEARQDGRYVSSGRFAADVAWEQAMQWRNDAHFAFRWKNIGEGKYAMRQARRELRKYRYYMERDGL